MNIFWDLWVTDTLTKDQCKFIGSNNEDKGPTIKTTVVKITLFSLHFLFPTTYDSVGFEVTWAIFYPIFPRSFS